MAYERLNLTTGDPLDEGVFKHLEDGIADLDLALDAKTVEVEKTYYSSNRFDKNIYEFVKGFYLANSLPSDMMWKKPSTSGAGAGWLNIPVEPGKTYAMSINNPLILSDMNNIVYGTFSNLWFTDISGKIIATVPRGTTYYSTTVSINPDQTLVQSVAYSASRVEAHAINGSDTYHGIGTSAMTFEIKNSEIAYMHVQIGSDSFGQYQLNNDFSKTRGHLTDAEIEQIINSFQINEGPNLLEYEEGGDYKYTELEAQSNLTKIQSAFTEKSIPSTNLLNPNKSVHNHKYVNNQSLASDGSIRIMNGNKAALLELPINGKGMYYLSSPSDAVSFGNKTFGRFGNIIFTDENNGFITGNYGYNVNSGVSNILDSSKVLVSGCGTTLITIKILDDKIKKAFVPLLDSDGNGYGLWTNFDQSEGLSNEELYELLYPMQYNKDKLCEWESFDNIKTYSVIAPQYIDGLDNFQESMVSKINDALANMHNTDKHMSLIIDGNNLYVRAKQFSETDLVWKMEKCKASNNKYFNIVNINTCPTAIDDSDVIAALSQWKNAIDDISPPNVQGTYIGANHGFNCVDKITVTGHDKTDADIGSVWIDGTNKTYVLTHIYDVNTLGFVMFNDTNMNNGLMGYGNPAVGSSLIHQSGASNTTSIVIEARESTQLWQCFNKYSMSLLVDGVKIDHDEDKIHIGDRIEILTQYNVIYVPAMLRYLMEHVGYNNADSQHSDEIEDYYMTMYINYQFNRNGSISTYSSFYMNKDISVGYISLVQSMSISSTPYSYVPDTITYQTPVLHEGVEQKITNTDWAKQDKAPYRFYQFADNTFGKGIILAYDRSIGFGSNEKRITQLSYTMRYANTKKMYPCFIAGGTIAKGIYFDGMAARVPLYKYDPDVTSVGWYWSNEDIHLMIDTHNSVNKDIILPDYMNNMRIEILDKTDSVTCNQTYIFNNKLRFISSEYGYLVLRLYK